jgi:exonuclease VII large subunit
MASAQTDTEFTYNPSSLLSIFSSNLNNEATRKVLKVKGIYTQGKGANYNGYYYDNLKDETSDASMTLVVPGLIRSQLTPNQTIECFVHLTKKMQQNAGRIDLQLIVVELLSKSSSTYSETQIKSFEIMEKKAALGLKDVDSFIKAKITKDEPISINIIIGKSAIIQEDIKHQLKEAIGYYKIHFSTINLASTKEIIENLEYFNGKTDILAIARGGGENLEIFENPDISEAALKLSTHFVTALGHAENVPLLQKIALD